MKKKLTMKARLLTAVLATMLSAFGLLPTVALAAPGVAEFTVGTVQAAPGDEVRLMITVADNPGFGSSSMTVNYDHSILQLRDISARPMLNNCLFVRDVSINDNFGTLTGSSAGITSNGEFVELTFGINANAPDGSYPVSLTLVGGLAGNFVNVMAVPIPVIFNAGAVIVDSTPPTPPPPPPSPGGGGTKPPPGTTPPPPSVVLPPGGGTTTPPPSTTTPPPSGGTGTGTGGATTSSTQNNQDNQSTEQDPPTPTTNQAPPANQNNGNTGSGNTGSGNSGSTGNSGNTGNTGTTILPDITPIAAANANGELPIWLIFGVPLLLAALALVIFFIIFFKRRKRKEEEQQKQSGIGLMGLILALMIAIPPVAAYADGATITVGGVEAANPGSEVTLPISIEGNPGFAAATLTFSYDRQVLELIGVGSDGLLVGGMIENIPGDTLGYFSMSEVKSDGLLFSAVFRVKDSAGAGNHAVAIGLTGGAESNFVNASGESVAVSFTVGDVQVSGEPVVGGGSGENANVGNGQAATDGQSGSNGTTDTANGGTVVTAVGSDGQTVDLLLRRTDAGREYSLDDGQTWKPVPADGIVTTAAGQRIAIDGNGDADFVVKSLPASLALTAVGGSDPAASGLPLELLLGIIAVLLALVAIVILIVALRRRKASGEQIAENLKAVTSKDLRNSRADSGRRRHSAQ